MFCVPATAKFQRARMSPRIGEEFRERTRGQLAFDRNHLGARSHVRHRDQLFAGIETELLQERGEQQHRGWRKQ